MRNCIFDSPMGLCKIIWEIWELQQLEYGQIWDIFLIFWQKIWDTYGTYIGPTRTLYSVRIIYQLIIRWNTKFEVCIWRPIYTGLWLASSLNTKTKTYIICQANWVQTDWPEGYREKFGGVIKTSREMSSIRTMDIIIRNKVLKLKRVSHLKPHQVSTQHLFRVLPNCKRIHLLYHFDTWSPS